MFSYATQAFCSERTIAAPPVVYRGRPLCSKEDRMSLKTARCLTQWYGSPNCPSGLAGSSIMMGSTCSTFAGRAQRVSVGEFQRKLDPWPRAGHVVLSWPLPGGSADYRRARDTFVAPSDIHCPLAAGRSPYPYRTRHESGSSDLVLPTQPAPRPPRPPCASRPRLPSRSAPVRTSIAPPRAPPLPLTCKCCVLASSPCPAGTCA